MSLKQPEQQNSIAEGRARILYESIHDFFAEHPEKFDLSLFLSKIEKMPDGEEMQKRILNIIRKQNRKALTEGRTTDVMPGATDAPKKKQFVQENSYTALGLEDYANLKFLGYRNKQGALFKRNVINNKAVEERTDIAIPSGIRGKHFAELLTTERDLADKGELKPTTNIKFYGTHNRVEVVRGDEVLASYQFTDPSALPWELRELLRISDRHEIKEFSPDERKSVSRIILSAFYGDYALKQTMKKLRLAPSEPAEREILPAPEHHAKKSAEEMKAAEQLSTEKQKKSVPEKKSAAAGKLPIEIAPYFSAKANEAFNNLTVSYARPGPHGRPMKKNLLLSLTDSTNRTPPLQEFCDRIGKYEVREMSTEERAELERIALAPYIDHYMRQSGLPTPSPVVPKPEPLPKVPKAKKTTPVAPSAGGAGTGAPPPSPPHEPPSPPSGPQPEPEPEPQKEPALEPLRNEKGAFFGGYKIDFENGKPVRIYRIKEREYIDRRGKTEKRVDEFKTELPLPEEGVDINDHLERLNALRKEIDQRVRESMKEAYPEKTEREIADGFSFRYFDDPDKPAEERRNIIRIQFYYGAPPRERKFLNFNKPLELPEDIQDALKKIGRWNPDAVQLADIGKEKPSPDGRSERERLRTAVAEWVRDHIMTRVYRGLEPVEKDESEIAQAIDQQEQMEEERERRRRETNERREAQRQERERIRKEREAAQQTNAAAAGVPTAAEPPSATKRIPKPAVEVATPAPAPVSARPDILTSPASAARPTTPELAAPRPAALTRPPETPSPDRTLRHDADHKQVIAHRDRLARAEETLLALEQGNPLLKFTNRSTLEKAQAEVADARAAYARARGEYIAPKIEDALVERIALVDAKVRAKSEREKGIFEKAWSWVSSGYRTLTKINPVERIVKPQTKIGKLVCGMFSVRSLISYGLIGVSLAGGVAPAIGVSAWLLNRALAGLGTGIGTYDLLAVWKRKKETVSGNLRALAKDEIGALPLDQVVEYLAARELDAREGSAPLTKDPTYLALAERWKELATREHADRAEAHIETRLHAVDVALERLTAKSKKDKTVRTGIAVALGLIIGSGALYKGVAMLRDLIGQPIPSAAVPQESARLPIEQQLQKTGHTLAEYKNYEQHWLPRLETLSQDITQASRLSVHDFEQIRNMASWEGTPIGDRAKTLLSHISGHHLLERSGILEVPLGKGSFYSALADLHAHNPELFGGRTADLVFSETMHHYQLDQSATIESLKNSFRPSGETLWISGDGAVISQKTHLLAEYISKAASDASLPAHAALDQFFAHHHLLAEAGFSAQADGSIATGMLNQADLQRALRRIVMDSARFQGTFTLQNGGEVENCVSNLYYLLGNQRVAGFSPIDLHGAASYRGGILKINDYERLAQFINGQLMEHAHSAVHETSPALRYAALTNPERWRTMLIESFANAGVLMDEHWQKKSIRAVRTLHEMGYGKPPVIPHQPPITPEQMPLPPKEPTTPAAPAPDRPPIPQPPLPQTDAYGNGVDLSAIAKNQPFVIKEIADAIYGNESNAIERTQIRLENLLKVNKIIIPGLTHEIMTEAFTRDLPREKVEGNISSLLSGITHRGSQFLLHFDKGDAQIFSAPK